jgi:hypothetical protein
MVATFVEPAGIFSMINWVPRAASKDGLKVLANTSAPPPGAIAIIIRIGLLGKSAANPVALKLKAPKRMRTIAMIPESLISSSFKDKNVNPIERSLFYSKKPRAGRWFTEKR